MNGTEERIERIRHYEEILDELAEALDDAERAVKRLEALREKKDDLERYYTGGGWRADYKADERGLLPADLKRGVLSQDTVFDLLTGYDALTRRED